MYQNHSDIPLLELKHQYFNRLPVCWEAERLKSPLCFAQFCFSFALCCGNEKHTSLSCLPAPNIFFHFYCIHFDTLDALSLSVLSLWHIYPPFFATSALLSLSSLNFLHPFKLRSFPRRRKSTRNASSWFIYCGACILYVYICVCTLPLNNSSLFPVMTSTFFAKSPCRLCH